MSLPELNDKRKAIIYDMIHKKMNDQLQLMREESERKQLKQIKIMKTIITISILIGVIVVIVSII